MTADPTPEERARALGPCPCDDPDEQGRSYRDADGLCGLCRHKRTKLVREIGAAEEAARSKAFEEAAAICDEVAKNTAILFPADRCRVCDYAAEEAAEKIRARAKEAPK